MQTWEQWIQINKSKLKHIAGFEERFVREILRNIPDISPTDVIAQYPFQELNAENRYVDFCIKNDTKGYLLFIELDGKWKDVTQLLERQNTLMSHNKGRLLRYINATWLGKPDLVIQTITQTLTEQHQEHLKKVKIQDLETQLQQQQQQMKVLTQQLQHVTKPTETTTYATTTEKILIVTFVIGCLLLGLYMMSYKDIKNAKNYTPQPETYQDDTIKQHPPITSNLASQYIGEYKTVCGYVAQVVQRSQQVYINLGAKYPNQDLGIIVWNGNIEAVKDTLNNSNSNNLCVYGLIEDYKGKPQINLSEPSQIK